MAINAREAKGGGKSQEPIDPGSYPARLVQIVDFGLQPQSYNGETKAPQQEISTTYELLDEFMKDEDGNDMEDKPRWVSETFALHNIAADRAKSTQRYYALDPKEAFEGDWQKLLGTPCIVTIVNKPGSGANKNKIYSNIAAVSAMRPREAATAVELKNDMRFFDQTDTSEANLDLFNQFPDWIKKKIKEGLEFEGSDFAEALTTYKPKDKDAKKDDKKPAQKQREPVEEDDEQEDGINF